MPMKRPTTLEGMLRPWRASAPLDVATIVAVKAEAGYVTAWTADDTEHILTATIVRLEPLLPDFMRISHGCLVNPAFARRLQWVDNESATCHVVAAGLRLPIARRYLVRSVAALALRGVKVEAVLP